MESDLYGQPRPESRGWITCPGRISSPTWAMPSARRSTSTNSRPKLSTGVFATGSPTPLVLGYQNAPPHGRIWPLVEGQSSDGLAGSPGRHDNGDLEEDRGPGTPAPRSASPLTWDQRRAAMERHQASPGRYRLGDRGRPSGPGSRSFDCGLDRDIKAQCPESGACILRQTTGRKARSAGKPISSARRTRWRLERVADGVPYYGKCPLGSDLSASTPTRKQSIGRLTSMRFQKSRSPATVPCRVPRSRKKDWRLPLNTICVTRSWQIRQSISSRTTNRTK